MSQKKYIFEKIEYRAVIKYLFLKGNSSKEIYDDMKKLCPSYSTIKSWTSNFKRGQFDLKDAAKSVFGQILQFDRPQLVLNYVNKFKS